MKSRKNYLPRCYVPARLGWLAQLMRHKNQATTTLLIKTNLKWARHSIRRPTNTIRITRLFMVAIIRTTPLVGARTTSAMLRPILAPPPLKPLTHLQYLCQTYLLAGLILAWDLAQLAYPLSGLALPEHPLGLIKIAS